MSQDAGAYGEAASGGAHFLARLLRSTMTSAPAECHLMPVPRGALADLKLVPLEHDLPPPGSVKVRAASFNLVYTLVDACRHGDDSAPRLEYMNLHAQVSVRAVGLNFRDVLNVLGMYPGDPGPPGGDCAGIVTAVGKGVELMLQP